MALIPSTIEDVTENGHDAVMDETVTDNVLDKTTALVKYDGNKEVMEDDEGAGGKNFQTMFINDKF